MLNKVKKLSTFSALCLLGLALVVVDAEAATKSRASVRRAKSRNVLLVGGLGLAMTSANTNVGTTSFAFNVGAFTRVAPKSPIYVGGEIGLDLISMSFGAGALSTSTTNTFLPILPTAFYEFRLGRSTPWLRPYIGIALGPYIGLSENTDIDFAFLLKPGVSFNVSPTFDIALDSKFGSVGGGFYLAPRANMIFKL